MAKMVTRTFTTTKVIALCMDVANAEPLNKCVTLPRTYDNEKKLLKEVEKTIADDNIKAVAIVSTEVIEKLYGMDEATFLANATELPPRATENN